MHSASRASDSAAGTVLGSISIPSATYIVVILETGPKAEHGIQVLPNVPCPLEDAIMVLKII
jgi:hypothetical protein